MAETERAISKLNKIQDLLEKEISYAAITEWENLHHEERECGASSYIQSWNKVISIGIRYKLRNSSLLTYRKRVSRNLLQDIMSVFLDYLIESRLDS